MIPLRDDVPPRRTPFVNYGIIAVSSLVFLLQLTDFGEQLIARFGMVPARVLDPDREILMPIEELIDTGRGLALRRSTVPLPDSWVPAWLTVLTCILLHGGWLHVIGNMWFLFVFGDNVEDRLGHVRYLLFYLGCGGAASLVHLVSGPSSTIPTIGASGSIAGVMGAYMLMYPHARVLALIPLGIIFWTTVVPAPLFLGVWFVIQFFQGTMAISATGGGVAWWAHVGGFAAGAGFAYFCKKRKSLAPEVEVRRHRPQQRRVFRVHRPRSPRDY